MLFAYPLILRKQLTQQFKEQPVQRQADESQKGFQALDNEKSWNIIANYFPFVVKIRDIEGKH